MAIVAEPVASPAGQDGPGATSPEPGPETIEPCTTQAKRLRHYSTSLSVPPHQTSIKGRIGQTLCGANAQSEERVNSALAYWGSDRRVVVADLPECRKCLKRAELHGWLAAGPDGEMTP